MKNSFCRICRGRFNLKYPPAAVDSEKKLSSLTITVQIDESGEISENICWDCEVTLQGFHKSVGEDNIDEEEPVVVDDDEILYKNLEKTIRIHRLSKEIEIIKIDSSDSEHEESVTIPKEDDIIRVESASTVVGITTNSVSGIAAVAFKKSNTNNMNIDKNIKKDIFTRGKIFESMRCPICPYLSGIECEVVLHIRQTHPQYTGDHLRFDQHEGDPTLTRRIIFARLLTFFECKVCGKIHDRFWAHRKHLTTHDRKNLKDASDENITALNKNEVLISHDNINKVQTSKRALVYVEDFRVAKNPKIEERFLRRSSKDINSTEVSPAVTVDTSKSLQDAAKKQQKHNANKKSKSKGLLRKQQMLQARRDKRRLKREEEKKAQSKSKPEPVIPKPTFKMPQQPAPRASSVVKQLINHPPYDCKLCSTTLASFITWNMHMIRFHSSTEFMNKSSDIDNVCRKCDKKLDSASNLRMHVRLSHRRKNRLVEINGNDNEEICRQTLTPKKVSKEEQPSDGCFPLSNGVSDTLYESTISSTSPLLCQYCGLLFADLPSMGTHESIHGAYNHAKRIFPNKLQA